MRPTLSYDYSLSLNEDERVMLEVLARELRESKNSVIRLALRELYEKKKAKEDKRV